MKNMRRSRLNGKYRNSDTFKLMMTVIMAVSILSGTLYAQRDVPLRLFSLQRINGSFSLEGNYRKQDTQLKGGLQDELESSLFLGKLELNTRSYMFHPNLVSIELGGEYNPATQRDRYLVIPDRSEINTAEKINSRVAFFSGKPINFSLFGSFNHSFTNREFTTNVEMYRTGFGVNFAFRNDILPFRLMYNNQKWDQEELQTGRKYRSRDNFYGLEFQKSFSEFDTHRLEVSYDDFSRDYLFDTTVENKIANIELSNTIRFGKTKGNYISFINYKIENGTIPFKRIQANESVSYELPWNFKSRLNYQFSKFEQDKLDVKNQSIIANLGHQLFESLSSDIYYEYNDFNQTEYKENYKGYGYSFDYKKKIPFGRLGLKYSSRQRTETRNAGENTIQLVNETHVLTDSGTELLKFPFVIAGSVTVTDETQTIIYQENIDFVLIERGNFLEIQRLPGGQIPAGATVLVNYTAVQQGSYEFTSNNNTYSASLSLFRNLLEFYFRYNESSFDDFSNSEALILKKFNQNVFGLNVRHKLIQAGYENDNFRSNIIPYKSEQYYVTIAGNLLTDLLASVTGNYRQYILVDDNDEQTFRDISARLIYNLAYRTHVKFDGSYRFQSGRTIDLDLLTFRGEFSTFYRELKISVGFETFKRDFFEEQLNYSSGYLRLERKF